jgi:ferredoxin-type protein NapF
MEADAVNLQRRLFLRGDVAAKRPPQRPPWAVAEASFTVRCSRCDSCLQACPEQLIVRGSGGFPEVDFRRGGCSFCGDCLRSCSDGALQPAAPTPQAAWAQRVEFLPGCLAQRGVVCRSCGDVCATRAIGFRLQLGGRAVPQLSAEACTGCGSCIAVCPVQAVTLQTIPAEHCA